MEFVLETEQKQGRPLVEGSSRYHELTEQFARGVVQNFVTFCGLVQMSSDQCHFSLEREEPGRYQAFMALMRVLVHECSLPELFHEIAKRLCEITPFDIVGMCLHEPAQDVMKLHVWDGNGHVDAAGDLPMDDTTAGWVWRHQQPLAFADVQQESRFQTCLNILRAKGIRAFCEVPMTTPHRRLGTLGLGSLQPGVYPGEGIRFLSAVARLTALAVENLQAFDALQEEKLRLRMLLEINAVLVNRDANGRLFPELAESIKRVVPHDSASIAVYDPATHEFGHFPLEAPSGQILSLPAATHGWIPATWPNSTHPAQSEPAEPRIFSREDLAGTPSTFVNQKLAEGIQSLCCIPLITHRGQLGTLNLASKENNGFHGVDVELLQQIASQVALALENEQAHREIVELKGKLSQERLSLEDEIHSELHFEEIVGETPILKRALGQAQTVATSSANVLILGETGTGKELLARAIHRMSARKDAAFVKLNCAAIPTGLLESELFGHEKGAFTGAISQKIGRLELGNKGTLFLDEVGDIPLELQPKLLRVLQDQEFERLGSNRTIRVDVRLIAATNKDLARSVAEREFRSDLYYRLNVFPIRMPALRERKGDIPLLVHYFVRHFAQRMNKRIEKIPAQTMKALLAWAWPGNVRELENFLERSVILSPGTELRVPLTELGPGEEDSLPDGTLESLEREHIVRVLRETQGVIAGTNGAAARLGLKRTTLQSRIARMGITREEYRT